MGGSLIETAESMFLWLREVEIVISLLSVVLTMDAEGNSNVLANVFAVTGADFVLLSLQSVFFFLFQNIDVAMYF